MTRRADRIKIKVRKLDSAEGLDLPAYQTKGSAGLDLVAAIPEQSRVRIAPGQWAMIPTGLEIALPRGTEAQVRPRSGLAARYGVTVLNSPGTIDADYRGEISVILINHGHAPFPVLRGDRIAQLVIARVAQAELVESAELGATVRGRGGFGSTGTRAEKSRDGQKRSKAIPEVKTETKPKTKAKKQAGKAVLKPRRKSGGRDPL